MKKFMTSAIALLSAMLIMAGCSNEPELHSFYPAGHSADTPETEAILINVGYTQEYPAEELKKAAEKNGIPEEILAEGAIDFADCTGDEWYLIIPKYDGTSVSAAEITYDENGLEVAGENIISTEKPLLIRCNMSDIMPSALVTVTAADGKEISFSPYISLKDGSIMAAEGIAVGFSPDF